MERDLLAAIDRFQACGERRDVAGADALLHERYALVLVQPHEVVMPRDRWLALLPDYLIHRYERHALVVDEQGDCGVSVQRASMSATVLGEDRSGDFVISDVWLRDDTRGWLLWRRHSTPLSAGRMPGAA